MYTAIMNTSDTSNTATPAWLSIQQVAERTGLSVHTLRYYEQIGLLDTVNRDAGGRRRYTPDDVAWIALLILMRDTGMPLAQIQAFAALMRLGPDGTPQRRALLEAHQAQVQ